MSILYIKESNCKVGIIKKMFNIITTENVKNNSIIMLPFEKNRTISEKQQERTAIKIANMMYDKQSQNIVLASNLENGALKKMLIEKNCKVLDGRWLFKFLIPKILYYISEKQGKELAKCEIALMTNNNEENNLQMIADIAPKVKMVNIITDDIDRFKTIESYLMEHYGIIIRVTNNRRKALIKSGIIINMDFSEEKFNKYNIPINGVIVNINKKINIKLKRFEGINCNYFHTSIPDRYINKFMQEGLFNEFDNNLLMESVIYQKRTYKDIKRELEDVYIEYLIGNNGKIEESEYIQKT